MGLDLRLGAMTEIAGLHLTRTPVCPRLRAFRVFIKSLVGWGVGFVWLLVTIEVALFRSRILLRLRVRCFFHVVLRSCEAKIAPCMRAAGKGV